MNIDEKLKLIRQVGEEIITDTDLKTLLESNEPLTAYDGFEPSGQIHIAQGLLRAINVNKMTSAGVRFKMWVADWHAMANNKLGGDLDKIQTTGKYFIEVWRACGMDLSKVEFQWASDMVKNPDYWKLVLQVGKTNALKRFIRTAEMMGREESLEKLTAAHIMYSCMQVADIFMLGAKITQLGMDQRKVNMLAREIGPQLGFWKPVVVSHHMLMGLTKTDIYEYKDITSRPDSETDKCGDYELTHNLIFKNQSWLLKVLVKNTQTGTQGEKILSSTSIDNQDVFNFEEFSVKYYYYMKAQHTEPVTSIKAQYPQTDSKKRAIALKMSKSKPDSAIFMTDTLADIKRKITKAYAPEGDIHNNPILEYCKFIIFESFERLNIQSLKIERPEKFGGNLEINTYEELEKLYADKLLHPMDLKQTVIRILDELLQPVRKHFEENAEAKKLLETVKGYQITR